MKFAFPSAQKFRHSGLLRNVGIYTFFGGLSQFIPFMLIPILTRYLPPAEYGLIATWAMLTSLAMPLIGMNMQGALIRDYFSLSAAEFRVYLGTILTLAAIMGCGLLLMVSLFRVSLGEVARFPQDWVVLVIPVACAQFLVLFCKSIWRAQHRPVLYGVFQTALTTVDAFLALLFVAGWGWGWQGRIVASAASEIAFAVIALGLCFRSQRIGLSDGLPYCGQILAYGIPLVPHFIAATLMWTMNRFFLNHFLGLAATGLYFVAASPGMILGFLNQSFNQAWLPYLYERLEKDGRSAGRKIVFTTYAYTATMFGIAVLMSVAAPIVLEVIGGKKYADGVGVVAWVSFGSAFGSLYLMVSGLILYTRRTYLLTMITVSSACLQGVLSYYCIPRNGIVGAAQAACAAHAFMGVSAWLVSRRCVCLPWSLGTWRFTMRE